MWKLAICTHLDDLMILHQQQSDEVYGNLRKIAHAWLAARQELSVCFLMLTLAGQVVQRKVSLCPCTHVACLSGYLFPMR